LTLNRGKNTTGVPAVKVKTSHFAMDLTMELNLRLCFSMPKKQVRLTCADASIQRIHRSAMVRTINCNLI